MILYDLNKKLELNYCVLSEMCDCEVPKNTEYFLPQLIYEFSSDDTHFYASFISSLLKKT